MSDLLDLAARLIRIDTRSAASNLPIVDLLEAELVDFTLERIGYRDEAGVEKEVLVAGAGLGDGPCLGLSAHLDTVPPVGWTRDPFAPHIEDGRLYGLGSTDMKGPLAAAISAARSLRGVVGVLLLLTTDEETTKAGAREVVERSRLLREHPPVGIVVVEPTGLTCVRGHRVDIKFTAIAHGIQAHSSTTDGQNANLALIPFLAEMRRLHLDLRELADLQDAAYDPPWCDLNIVIDNHGAPANLTVGRATCRMKFRYSRAVDPGEVVGRVRRAAMASGLELDVIAEPPPPELPPTHPLVEAAVAIGGAPARVVGFGSDAAHLAKAAPCIVFGPGSITDAHTPNESIAVADLGAAVSKLTALGRRLAASSA
jgi:acetylornithine deacetylase/succinyl-diaminopimelate desuccinylase-like protein